MKNIALITFLFLILNGCQKTLHPNQLISPQPRYSVSAKNIQKLKTYKNAKVEIAYFIQPIKYSPQCHFVGAIEPAFGLSFTQFFENAFNAELKLAGIFSNSGVKLIGIIEKLQFSSGFESGKGIFSDFWDLYWDIMFLQLDDMTDGFWNIALKIESSNGESLSVEHTYCFKTSLDAHRACNITADALLPAVQETIYLIITNPHFAMLLK